MAGERQFAQYQRKQIAELMPWEPGLDMHGISVSDEDRKAGSPKQGDMIARNPKNHADLWLVAKDYFADNFEPVHPAPAPEAGGVEPAYWAVWSATGSHIGLWEDEADAREALRDYEERIPKMTGRIEPLYATPQPAQVSEGVASRPETGPMQFVDDWPGLFIRGDDALHYSSVVRAAADAVNSYITKVALTGLAGDLASVRSPCPNAQQAALQSSRKAG